LIQKGKEATPGGVVKYRMKETKFERGKMLKKQKSINASVSQTEKKRPEHYLLTVGGEGERACCPATKKKKSYSSTGEVKERKFAILRI